MNVIGPVAGMIAGKIIDRALGRAMKLIEKTTDKQMEVIRNAAQEVHLVLENLKCVYRDSLDLTIEKVDEVFQKNLFQIESALEALETRTIEDMGNVLNQIQNLMDTIPLRETQIYKVDPSNIILKSAADKVLISFKGRFPHIGNGKATLKLGNHEITAEEGVQGSVGFIVPKDYFYGLLKDSDFCLSVGRVRLYRKRWYWCCLVQDATFRVPLPIFNCSPGTIRLEVKTKRLERKIAEIVSPQFTQNLRTIHHEKLKTSRVFILKSDQHWNILHGTHAINIASKNGINTHNFEGESDNEVRYRVITATNKHNKNGNIVFSITAKQFQDEEVEDCKIEEIFLNWGERQVKELPPGASWKVIFDSFNGVHSEFIKPEINDPTLKILQTGNQLEIQTKAPASKL